MKDEGRRAVVVIISAIAVLKRTLIVERVKAGLRESAWGTGA